MADPKPTISYFVSRLAAAHPRLAYIHLIEPRIDGNVTRSLDESDPSTTEQSNDFLRDIWSPRPVISTGAYTRDLAIEVAERKGDLIAFGRVFIANVCTSPFALLHLSDITLNPDHLIYSLSFKAQFAQSAQEERKTGTLRPFNILL